MPKPKRITFYEMILRNIDETIQDDEIKPKKRRRKKEHKLQTHPLFETVGEAGMTSPCHPLIVRQVTRSLRFEV